MFIGALGAPRRRIWFLSYTGCRKDTKKDLPASQWAMRNDFLLFQPASKLNITQKRRLAQRSQRVALRHELVRDVALKAQVGDRLHHRPPIQLLRVVNLVASGHSAGVEVRDVLNVLADGA